ncbi:MAG: 3-methyl-2-oxobutanoate hydroxymethyltransferase [Acidobacteriota bacterium]
MSTRTTPFARVTIPSIREARSEGRRLVMVTAYDTPSGRAADEAGVDIVLVGDSLAMVVLGHPDTLSVTVDEMVHHTAAVSRGVHRALVVGDMPFLSYHTGWRDAVMAAGRFVQKGRAAAVKLEGGRKRVDVITALVDAEIPVMGHVGLTPQSLHTLGGYRVQGRRTAQAEMLLADALAVAKAGAFAVVLEGLPDRLGAAITAELPVPTIGIGAGGACDGQVLVFHDLLGWSGPGPSPRFVRRYADLGQEARRALTAFAEDVRSGRYPSNDETYPTPEPVATWLRDRAGGRSQRETA